MPADCLFCKIINKEIPANIVYEDDKVLAFRDISPQAPIHSLIIPHKHINTINDASTDDQSLLGHMILVAEKIAKENGVEESGYRLVMNCNEHGGQTVFHIHLHILSGRQLTHLG
ncbi:MAG: histidine triad nucleotide-binding protein [Gammaproteobacteria bacterium]|nr:histidine triad nucleotide-binding protein [Gammaproteobacteria bacterium]